MMKEAWRGFWRRRRPTEGWLPLALLLLLTGCLVGAVLAAGWVPEEQVIIPAAFGGLLLGLVLAVRPLSPFSAWLLLILYGLLVNGVWLGRLFPPLNVLLQGWGATSNFWRIQGALFFDRTASWFQAFLSGGRSTETLVFALGMGLLAWLLAAYAAWSTYRQHRPLHGLTVMGFVLALNTYFGEAPLYWAAAFVGLVALLTALAHLRFLEMEWLATAVDYSEEIRIDLAMHASAITLILVTTSFILPAFSITRLVDFFKQQPAVQEIEQTWERVFSGVQPPAGPESGLGQGEPGGAGIMPRAYLLGNAPELTETVVMTAVVTTLDGAPLTPVAMAGLHWRALSYEIYTGRGWTITEEREEDLPAGALIPIPHFAAQTQYRQKVHWLYDGRTIRYTLGFPLAFAEPVTVHWRGLEDLVRVQGSQNVYDVTTTHTIASPEQLRRAALAEVPPTVLGRYTALPDSMPQRVRELAQEVAGGFSTPYDQARALERFLRQYPYTLDVEPAPAGADVVAYFLFAAQRGYCDFYASAMVVMARSLGLPARMAVGYLAQPPDEQGVQVVRQIHGHSWAEVYLGEYGWVVFEPTAGLARPRETAVPDFPLPAAPDNPFADAEATDPLPLPAADPAPFVWVRWGVVALLGLLLAVAWWWQAHRPPANSVLAVYGRFQQQALKLGAPVQASQTPQEFAAGFLRYLKPLTTHPRPAAWVQALQEPVLVLTAVFEQWQYAPPEERQETAVAHQVWQKMRRPLWWLRLLRGWYGR